MRGVRGQRNRERENQNFLSRIFESAPFSRVNKFSHNVWRNDESAVGDLTWFEFIKNIRAQSQVLSDGVVREDEALPRRV